MSRLILPKGYRRRQGGFILPAMLGGKKGSGSSADSINILFADGFDDWTSVAGEYGAIGNTPTIATGQGRRGNNALELNAITDGVGFTAFTPVSEIFLAIAHKATALPPSPVDLLTTFSGGTVQVRIRLNADGSIQAARNTTTIATSAAGLVSGGVYFQIQVRIVFSDTAGLVQIRLNGSSTPILDVSGVDTNNAAGGAANLCSQANIGGLSAFGFYNDYVVWTATGDRSLAWIGDARVDTLFANANGDSSQFVGSDGNSTDNYLLIDAAAPNGTDYVQSDTIGNKDLYNFGSLPYSPSTIYGVVATGSALKTVSDTRSIRFLAKSSGTEADNGADIALNTARTRHIGVFNNSPATGVRWTESGVNAMQIGQTVTQQVGATSQARFQQVTARVVSVA